jgi:hypothetical protein
LLTMLGEAAVARGIRRFVALYFVDNHDVEGLVTGSGLTHRSQVSLGVVEAQLDLPPARQRKPRAQPPA